MKDREMERCREEQEEEEEGKKVKFEKKKNKVESKGKIVKPLEGISFYSNFLTRVTKCGYQHR
jgi:hypothetical protein